jgi:undecaprenyl-diphosphatase
VGTLLGDRVERAFHSTTAAGIGLLGTALILCAGEWARRRGAESAPPADHGRLPAGRAVLLVGLAQALAILPGVSRSGTTIAAGLLLGLPPAGAARLSFLLSVPAVAGAAVMTLPDAMGAEQAGPGALPLLWAVALAALIGWGALRLLLAFLDRGAFLWFAAYTALLGAGVLLLA